MMKESLLTPEILLDISQNEAFKTVFFECMNNSEFRDAFNRLHNSNIHFASTPKDAISALIDEATGYKGLIATESESQKLIFMIYNCVYLPMLHKFEAV